MQVSVELSLYPLSKDFEKGLDKNSIFNKRISILDSSPEIKAKYFDQKLKDSSLEVQTNGMSTQVFGEMDIIMEKIGKAMKEVYAENKAILVMKMGKGTLKL